MLDRPVRRLLTPGLDAVGGWLAAAGVRPLAVTGAGWVAGVGACVAVGFGQWTLGLVLWLLNRLLDGLDGPVARRRGATDLGGFLDIVADFSIYAGFVLAVAVAVPDARVAALALLTAYYVSGTAFLALSSLIERRGSDRGGGSIRDGRSLRFVGGLAEGTETVIVYVLFCLFPGHAALIAWVFTAAVAVTAAQRIVTRRAGPAPTQPRPGLARHDTGHASLLQTGTLMRAPRPTRLALAAALAMTVTACTSAGSVTSPTTSEPVAVTSAGTDWDSVLAQANGQTVNWYMYGGDDTLNAFVTGYVADQLGKLGVTMNQVKITDTGDASTRSSGRCRPAGPATDRWTRSGSTGRTSPPGCRPTSGPAGGTRPCRTRGSSTSPTPPSPTTSAIPVNGCEAVWQQADSALVYDSAKLDSTDVASITTLFDWARANPGQFTYPAPPDFTGSMAVRTILYDAIGGPASLAGPFDETNYGTAAAKLWSRLNDIAGSLWRGGETYPQSQTAVEKLYSDGEISAFFTYGPGAVGDQVDKGLFPASTREAVLAGGNIGNRSFVAIPANAAHHAAAMVLANVLQDPQSQLELLKSKGIYPGIDLAKTSLDVQAQFAAVPVHPSVLPLMTLTENTQPELSAGYLARIEQDWITNVLQRQ